MPVEGVAVGLDVPERGHDSEDRDLDVVVCEPDRVRVGLLRAVFVLTRMVDGGRLSDKICGSSGEAWIKVLPCTVVYCPCTVV